MKKRFRFRLDVLLRQRMVAQRLAQRAVAVQQTKIVELDRLCQEIDAEVEATQATLRLEQQGDTLDPASLARGRAWLAHLRALRVGHMRQRAELANQLTALTQKLVEARRQTRVLETLRESKLAEFRRARTLREQAEIDELAQRLPFGEFAQSSEAASAGG